MIRKTISVILITNPLNDRINSTFRFSTIIREKHSLYNKLFKLQEQLSNNILFRPFNINNFTWLCQDCFNIHYILMHPLKWISKI